MPRKAKKPFRHTKQQNVESEDGWTHVVRGPTIKTANSNDKSQAAAKLQKLLNGREFETVEEMQASYERNKDLVQRHPATLLFRNYLNEQLTSHDNVACSHVVCLGLGHFDHGYGQWSFKQLCWLQELIVVLRQRERIAQPEIVYFQDPAFTELDTVFLTSLGYRVIPWPRQGSSSNLYAVDGLNDDPTHVGQSRPYEMKKERIACGSYFSDTMFLFTPHIEHYCVPEAFRKAHPALFLGPNLLELDQPLFEKLQIADSSDEQIGDDQVRDAYKAHEVNGADEKDKAEEDSSAKNGDGKLSEHDDFQEHGDTRDEGKNLLAEFLKVAAEQYDWQSAVQQLGESNDDHDWYNDIVFGLKKVSADCELDSAARDAKMAEMHERHKNDHLLQMQALETKEER